MLFEMTFFEDFRKILNDLKFIPEVSVKRTVELEMNAVELEKKVNEKDAKIAALEKELKELKEKQ